MEAGPPAEAGGGASTGKRDREGKRLVIGFFPEERDQAEIINPLAEAQDISFLYRSKFWELQPHTRPTPTQFFDTMCAVAGEGGVVHFAGHCDEDGSLHFLKDREGRESEHLKASAMVGSMKGAVQRGAVVCVVLNACDSLSLGERLYTEAGVPHVVCWKGGVADDLATDFAVTFWESLDVFPEDIRGAVQKCKTKLLMAKQSAFAEGSSVSRVRLCLLSTEGDDLPGNSEDEEDWGPPTPPSP